MAVSEAIVTYKVKGFSLSKVILQISPRRGISMQNLYQRSLGEENIKQAIAVILKHEGSKTAGPDGINKYNLPKTERIIKEVKARLRRYKRVNSKETLIPKKNGKTRTLTILNLFDRIAQQAIYQIIQPILERKFSRNSYGFRTGINAKIPTSKICTLLTHTKSEIYTVEMDFSSCFDKIKLERAIGAMKDLGIKDHLLIKTVKHLMHISKDYNGIGLGQGTILGPILCNCYLHKLDTFIEEEFETVERRKTQWNRAKKRHEQEWISFLAEKQWPIFCKYYRYADDSIIICYSKEEQSIIYAMISTFVEKELELEINEAKTKLGNNEPIEFLGFRLSLDKEVQKVSIRIAKEKEYLKRLKDFNLNTKEDLVKFQRFILGVLNYFDICNNMKSVINAMYDRLFIRGVHKRNGILEKVEGHQIYRSKRSAKTKNREIIEFDIWEWRRSSKKSFKDYLIRQKWLLNRDRLCDRRATGDIEHVYNDYTWLLFTKQKGCDPISKEELKGGNMIIHHIIPIEFGGNNSLKNLILLNRETHELIHNNEDTNNKSIKYYRSKAMNNNLDGTPDTRKRVCPV